MAERDTEEGFNWKRRWVTLVPDHEISLGTHRDASENDSELVSLRDVADTPCLVLLSEPGMGKSWELAALAEFLGSEGKQVDLVIGRDPNLPGILDALLLSDNCRSWAVEDRQWHILIDGVDEISGGLEPKRLLDNFLDRLFGCGTKVGLLKIAFTCRTSAWTDQLDQMIEDRWPPDAFKRLTLQPLSDNDIRTAVEKVELGAESKATLIAHLSDEKMRAVAGRPFLLALLFDRHRTSVTLPTRQTDLIEFAIKAALRETGGSIDDQLAMVGRLAAASTFSDLRRLTTALGSADSDTLSVSRISGGVEPTRDGSVTATPALFSLCMQSALFVEVAPKIFEWSHRIFSDFLAARYLADHRLSSDEILSLLIVPEVGGPGGIAPSLTEVAGWAAVMIPGLFDELLDRQPDVLLQSQAAALEPADRARLTKTILGRFAAGDLIDRYDQLLPLLGRLDHPQLEEQLLSLISGAETPSFARRAAIDLAAAAGKTALTDAIIKVAEDPKLDGVLRMIAARAIRGMSGAGAGALLAPVLDKDLSSDTDDRLRGTVLQASWPDAISFRKLLAALTVPKRSNLLGPYQLFLYRFEMPALLPEQALEAIEWLRLRLDVDDGEHDRLGRIMARLFWAAASQILTPQVADAMAGLIVAADHGLSRIVGERAEHTSYWPGDGLARASLVEKVLQQSPDPLRGVVLFYNLPDLIVPHDLDEYLKKLTAAREGPLRDALSRIVVELAVQLPIDTLDEVWEVGSRVPPLQSALNQRYSIELDSPAAVYMRRNVERERDAARLKANEEATAAAWRSAADGLLDRIEAGDAQLWWQLNIHLFHRPTGGYDSHFEFDSDLTKTPGWSALEEPERERITRTAFDYLVREPLSDTSWLGTNTSHRPANAGVRALRLLRDKAPDTFAALREDTWASWAPATVGFFGNDIYEGNAQRVLVAEAYRKAPIAVMSAIRQIATGSKSEGISSRQLDLLEAILDAPLASLLRELHQSSDLKGDDAKLEILSFLVRSGDTKSIAVVVDALENAGASVAPRDPAETRLLARATVELLLRDPRDIWLKLLELRDRDDTFAREIWSQLAEQVAFDRSPILDDLSEYTLAQGYIDLVSLLPERPSPEVGARVLSAPDFVDQLRSILLRRLVALGTNVALEQLHRVQRSIPDGKETLHWSIEEARRNVRANHIRREDPADVLLRIGGMGLASTSAAPPAPPGKTPQLDAAADGSIDTDIPAPKPDPSGPLPEAQRRTILAVATEWKSLHGGISTLNRDLCTALAALGHAVVCLVPEASEAEINDATTVKVKLVGCPQSVGITGIDCMLLCQVEDIGGKPDLVIGHDHITGRFARALATRFSAKYVHFLHTIPQENEGLKTPRADTPRDVLDGETKLEKQLKLANEANLVVAVGPRIKNSFLMEAIDPPRVCVLVPGLSPELLKLTPDPSNLPRNTCFMSARMEDALVKGGLLACDVIKIVGNGRDWAGADIPVLIMRGFSENANAEFAKIGEMAKYAQFVQLRSFTTDPLKLTNGYLKAALILMPSVAEGFGLTGLEAIAAGVPVIISESSGLAEYLRNSSMNDGLPLELVDPCIAPVHLSDEDTRNAWAAKVDAALFDRKAAFERAAELRKALRIRLTWDRAARNLSTEFESL